MSVISNRIKNWYGDRDDLSIASLFQEEDKEGALAKLPYDIFDHLSKYLDRKDRKCLAMVCKSIYQYSIETAIYREFNLIKSFNFFLIGNLNQEKYKIEFLKLKNLYDKLDIDNFKYRYENLVLKRNKFHVVELREEIEYVKEVEVEILKIRDIIFNLLKNVKHTEVHKLQKLCAQVMPRFFEDFFDIARIRRMNIEKSRYWFLHGIPQFLEHLLKKYPVFKVFEIISTYFIDKEKDIAIYQLFIYRLDQVVANLDEYYLNELIRYIQNMSDLAMKKRSIEHLYSALFLKSAYRLGEERLVHRFEIETEKVIYIISSVFTDIEIRDYMFAKLSFNCRNYLENIKSFYSLKVSTNSNKPKDFALSISDELKRMAVLLGLEDSEIRGLHDLERETLEDVCWHTSTSYLADLADWDNDFL